MLLIVKFLGFVFFLKSLANTEQLFGQITELIDSTSGYIPKAINKGTTIDIGATVSHQLSCSHIVEMLKCYIILSVIYTD